jgi:tyrosinase
MNMATSPTDPIFWLLHCMVDRLWEEWQVNTGFFKTPPNPNETLLPSPMFTHRVGELLDVRALGYRYDGVPFRLPDELRRTGGTVLV